MIESHPIFGDHPTTWFLSHHIRLGVWLTAAFLFVLRILLRKRAETAVGFFHPYCDGMGGGERVLWCAVQALQKTLGHEENDECEGATSIEAAEAEEAARRKRRANPIPILIYTSHENAAKKDEILAAVQRKFGIKILSSAVQFVGLSSVKLCEASCYPKFTVLLQSVGGAIVAAEGFLRRPCSVFIESTGFAFSFPVAKMLGASVVLSYIHYPTMSHDMLNRVRDRNIQNLYNNSEAIRKSSVLTYVKLAYYRFFLGVYGLCGWFADFLWCNSSWTRARIVACFGRESTVELLHPPADLSHLLEKNGSSGRREDIVLSLAQFRPEKEQNLQVEAWAKCVGDGSVPASATFYMLGSTRNADDEALVTRLRDQIHKIDEDAEADGGNPKLKKFSGRIKVQTNLPWDDIVGLLGRAKVALHTMRDEHFGISFLEFLASRLICVSHDSGGPATDLLTSEFQAPFRCQAEPAAYAAGVAKAFEVYATASVAGGGIDGEVKRLRESGKFPGNREFGAAIARRVDVFLRVGEGEAKKND